MKGHETINTIIALVGTVTGILSLWLRQRDSAVRLRISLDIPTGDRVNANGMMTSFIIG